LQEAKQE